MPFKTTAALNVRTGPGTAYTVVRTIPAGTIVQGDDGVGWKAVVLADGTRGFCSAAYLETVQGTQPVQATSWVPPVPKEYFVVSQTYLNEDWALYPKFGHHTGVDYGGHGRAGIPLFACSDGEILYRDTASSAWGASLGNHAALYVPSVDRSFLYCHMASEPHALGAVRAGEQIGVMGNTGKSSGGAIHLHLEGFYGRFTIAERAFTSLDDIKKKTFDANVFISDRL